MDKAKAELRAFVQAQRGDLGPTAKDGMTQRSLSRSLGRNRDYLGRFLTRPQDQPLVVISIQARAIKNGLGPIFSYGVMQDAADRALEMREEQDQRRRHHQLVGCVRDLEEAPCDKCEFHEMCKARVMACQAFYVYTTPTNGVKLEEATRKPSKEWYVACFPDYDIEDNAGSEHPDYTKALASEKAG